MLDNITWQPSASINTLQQRARILAAIRQFFNDRGYLEVETPLLSRFGVTDVYLSNVEAEVLSETRYLPTSPEYHMKRLLASGSGPIYQLARVFRDDELGRWHNPEFTMLEWYQLNIDHHALMAEMDLFLQSILHCSPLVKKTYQHAFIEVCDLDPLDADISELNATLKRFGLEGVLPSDECDSDQFLFLLMSHVVEPTFAKKQAPVAIYNFPPSQAALAQINNGVAERFEIYCQGVELANGFHELTDAALQRARFIKDKDSRLARGISSTPPDEYLLQALEHGLPPCSGVALGIDRLLAIALNVDSISETLSFDFSRA